MPGDSARRDPNWWQRAVVYQIYPRSFQDTNGDGIGDLQGIIDRLDYLNDGTERSLGIDAIWLSPTFPSPMKDFGYDVSDYRGVHPDFGDLAAMDRLIAECHRRDIKLLLDYVPNHTSDQHPWFLESRSSRTNPRRDWYIWRDARPDGSLPNNWQSAFGGPAWTYDETTGQYYLHSFLKEQPDLNWRNPEVEQAMHDVLRFWLERGIDGFRMDVIGMILKHPDLLDNPQDPSWAEGVPEHRRYLLRYNRNFEDVYEAVRRIRKVLDEYPGSVAVGEVFGTHQEIARYYGGDRLDGLHLAFNFKFIHDTERMIGYTPWEAGLAREILLGAEAAVPPGGLPCYAFANHDRPRFITRHNEDGRGFERARAAALFLLGLRAVPFLYYGEEIGMTDVDIPEERLQDPARFRSIGRDPERTPMQWDASPGRGFSTAEPWLPFGDPAVNVADQADDPESLLSLYRAAIWTRKREASLHSGTFRMTEAPETVVAFLRQAPGARPVLVVVNMSTEPVAMPSPLGLDRVLLATDPGLAGRDVSRGLHLPPLGAAWVVPEGD
ncbi:MAG: alpha-amylase family glycosyl hydrolase [Hyphomicrobiales bacterium]